jgi:hypothetical protein
MSIISFLLIQGNLICWAILDLQFRDYNYELKFRNIFDQYKETYLAFFPISIIIPCLILFIDSRYPTKKPGI